MKSLSLLLLLLAFTASAAQIKSSFVLHGERDLHTNAPSITIRKANNTTISVGDDWLTPRTVENGDVWMVLYPSTDCQSNATYGAAAPVSLNGIYTNIDANGFTNVSKIWMRLPVGYRGMTVVFGIDPYTPFSLTNRYVEYMRCSTPLTPPAPLARLSLWGNTDSDDEYIFWGTGDISAQTVLDLAVGCDHGLLLSDDNTVSVFAVTPDANISGKTMIPDDAVSNVVQVACGKWHSLVLLKNGTVKAWGENTSGQINVPTNLTGVAAVACGSAHSMALTTNGTLVVWGNNVKGEGSVPAGLSNVVQVAGGSYFTAALKRDGTVVVWGDNDYGVTNVPSGLSSVVRVTCGGRHVSALKSDGTVVTWGSGFSSPTIQNVIYMVSGDNCDWFVTSDGAVAAVNINSTLYMPWSVTNTVLFSARGSTFAVLSGPVKLGVESLGGTNANIVWPAAAAGRITTGPTLYSTWGLTTNTVKYLREKKLIHISDNSADTTRFFRLTPNSSPVTLGIGGDVLRPPLASGIASTNIGGGSPPFVMAMNMTPNSGMSVEESIMKYDVGSDAVISYDAGSDADAVMGYYDAGRDAVISYNVIMRYNSLPPHLKKTILELEAIIIKAQATRAARLKEFQRTNLPSIR